MREQQKALTEISPVSGDENVATHGESLVLPFEKIDRSMLSLVGGKGANLGEMARAGLPVTPGFCITTRAYDMVARTASVAPLLAQLASVEGTDVARLADLAEQMRAFLLAEPIPAALSEIIGSSYIQLAAGDSLPVAVRSSATAEDLPFASFAGQQDTFLNVVGREAVLDAVRRCWASLWTERAVVYRQSNHINQQTVSLSVVVQSMVDVEVAGVLFTANPLTGRRRQAVIDANPGLGEAVVSGAVNPDHFVVNTVSGEIVERRLGDKRLVIRSVAGGGTERVESEQASDKACISDEQARELAKLGARVEAHYGAPQDTEWTIDREGSLWLTQARPITTLYPLPASAPQSDDVLRIYLSFNAAQGVYQPLTPMGLALFRSFAQGAAVFLGYASNPDPETSPFSLEAAHRLFLDTTTPFRNPIGRKVLLGFLRQGEMRTAMILSQVENDPRLRMTTSKFDALRVIARIIRKSGAPFEILRILARPDEARMRLLQVVPTWRSRLPATPTATERMYAAGHLYSYLPRQMLTAPCVVVASLASFFFAGKLLGKLATADELQTVLRGLPYNPTTEMDLKLWTLARKISADEAATQQICSQPLEQLLQEYLQGNLPSVVQQGLAEFLQAYGHRGVAEIDVGLPRWADDPTHILGVLVNYLQLKDQDLAPDLQFQRGAQQGEAMVKELTKRAAKRGWWRGRVVGFLLGRVRALLGLREMPKFILVSMMKNVRELVRSVGEELVRAGRLEQVDDIFFLKFTEAQRAIEGEDMRARVREQRASYQQEMTRRSVPHVLLSDGTVPTVEVTEGADGMLSGAAASAGRVTARARVVMDPRGAQLQPGEILVAPSTDPGWTPLFLTASGLVMEMGGAMSHGAVVAREYGIPAVVGVTGATAHIKTGQMITVDGSSGKISLND